jgi:vacuolar-type H+-ATPase subunit H
MSMGDIEKILEAEAGAEKLRAETAEKVDKLLSSAKAEGGAIYASVISKAEQEAKRIKNETAEKIKAASKAALDDAVLKASELKSSAAVNVENAARIICERVLKG